MVSVYYGLNTSWSTLKDQCRCVTQWINKSYSDSEHDAFDLLVLVEIHLIHLPVCASLACMTIK